MDMGALLPYYVPESSTDGAGKKCPLSSKKGLSCILFQRRVRIQLLISLHQVLTDSPVWEVTSSWSQADSFLLRPFYEMVDIYVRRRNQNTDLGIRSKEKSKIKLQIKNKTKNT